MIRLLTTTIILLLLRGLAFAQFMDIGGVIETSRGVPIPGCVVRLLNPDTEPTYPVSTGAIGDYYFSEVRTDVSSLYTIEVQWGRSIIYRDFVKKGGLQEPIIIPVQ